MTLHAWTEDKSLGKEPCKNARDSWQCPNMLSTGESDTGKYEYYACLLCGKRETIDWDECK